MSDVGEEGELTGQPDTSAPSAALNSSGTRELCDAEAGGVPWQTIRDLKSDSRLELCLKSEFASTLTAINWVRRQEG